VGLRGPKDIIGESALGRPASDPTGTVAFGAVNGIPLWRVNSLYVG
jgi:hypothetical protein